MKNRILIIDDDIEVRNSLQRVLREAGHAVALAADGQEGVDCLSDQTFDLLVLDLNLPKVSGFDILDLVSRRFPLLPIVVLTGLVDQCEPGAVSSADAFLEKPPDVAQLLNILETLLAHPAEERLRRLDHRTAAAPVVALRSARQYRAPRFSARASR